MRLLNRSAGRLSRHRRGPLAGLVVLLLGLLMTGSLYAAFSPAQADQTQSSTDQAAARAVSSSSSAAPSATGRTVRASRPRTATRSAPRSSASAPRRSTSRSAPAACRWPSPVRRPRARSRSTPTRRSPQLAAYVASLGPGPSVPTASDYSTAGMSDEERQEAIVRGGQIFLTNCTACHNFEGSGGAMPRGGYAPKIRGVDPKYIYEAMLTGPQAMDSFSNGNLSPEEKRDVIAYLGSLNEAPGYGGFGLGGLGPVSEGLFALARGPRLPGRLRRLDRRPHHALDQEEGGSVSDSTTTPRTTTSCPRRSRTSRSPTRACRRTSGVRRTSTRRRRSAPSARSPRCSGSRCSARSSSWSPTSPSTSAATGTTRSAASAPPTSPWALPRLARCSSSASASSSGRASSWVTTRSSSTATPPRPPRRTARPRSPR